MADSLCEFLIKVLILMDYDEEDDDNDDDDEECEEDNVKRHIISNRHKR